MQSLRMWIWTTDDENYIQVEKNCKKLKIFKESLKTNKNVNFKGLCYKLAELSNFFYSTISWMPIKPLAILRIHMHNTKTTETCKKSKFKKK